jgi:hypothetical protein
MELLGTDKERMADIYLDRATGKIYKKVVELINYPPGNLSVVNSIIKELIDDVEVIYTDDIVLSTHN